jgi:hypothetical protein
MPAMEQPDAGPPPDLDSVPGGAAPRYMPPMRRRPPSPGEPTPAQARLIARAGLVLTLALAVAGLAGVVWAILAAAGVAH